MTGRVLLVTWHCRVPVSPSVTIVSGIILISGLSTLVITSAVRHKTWVHEDKKNMRHGEKRRTNLILKKKSFLTSWYKLLIYRIQSMDKQMNIKERKIKQYYSLVWNLSIWKWINVPKINLNTFIFLNTHPISFNSHICLNIIEVLLRITLRVLEF